MKRQLKASVTLYILLLLIFVVTLLFTILELGRVKALKATMTQKTYAQTESIYGAYHKQLYEKYGLFFLEIDQEKDQQVKAADSIIYACNQGSSHDFLGMNIESMSLDASLLATDKDGEIFRQEAATLAENLLLDEGLEKLVNQVKETASKEEIEESKDDVCALLEDMEKAKKLDEQEKAEEKKEESAQQKALVKKYGNPAKSLKKQKASLGLEFFIEEMGDLSSLSIETDHLASHRSLSKGMNRESLSRYKRKANLSEDLLYIAYLNHYFQNYTSCQEETGLKYELEYILCGKASDEKNLKATVNKLLLLREGCNYKSLLQDKEKSALALSLAEAILAPFGLEGMSKVLQQGILLAWAYGESVLDVRALLDGKKVALIKTKEQWTLQLEKLGDITDVSFQAKECEKGMTYQQYLWALLKLQGEKTQTLRTMDLIEINLRKTKGNSDFSMDQMMLSSKMTYHIRAKSLFLSLIWTTKKEVGTYLFDQEIEYSY